MLRVASLLEKGVNGMLDRVSNLSSSSTSTATDQPTEDDNGDPRALARNVYDLTLGAFHPTTGISPNEHLWFKTNLKYGQLVYEMNETAKLHPGDDS